MKRKNIGAIVLGSKKGGVVDKIGADEFIGSLPSSFLLSVRSQ